MNASRENDCRREAEQPIQRSYIDIVRDTPSSREIWRDADCLKYVPSQTDTTQPDEAVGTDRQ